MFHVPEIYRITDGPLGTPRHCGNYGAFRIECDGRQLNVIATDGRDDATSGVQWQHVSVSTHNRCPTWREMHFARMMFWSVDDTVYQIHPPESLYVNYHPHCLHLWRPIGIELPLPPIELIGPIGNTHKSHTFHD